MHRFPLVPSVRLAVGLAALAMLGAAAPARADALEICIAGCVKDYYPFHHTCVLGCALNDLVFGVSGVYDDGEVFQLSANRSERSSVVLAAASYDSSGRLDPDVYEVGVDYLSLDAYTSGSARWTDIGSGVLSSRSESWEVGWDASRVPSGEYVVRATFYALDGFREAFLAVRVP